MTVGCLTKNMTMRATKTNSCQHATDNDYKNSGNCFHFDVNGVQLNTSIDQFIFNGWVHRHYRPPFVYDDHRANHHLILSMSTMFIVPIIALTIDPCLAFEPLAPPHSNNVTSPYFLKRNGATWLQIFGDKPRFCVFVRCFWKHLLNVVVSTISLLGSKTFPC